MNANAGETIERIRRGHFRLSFVQHGEKLENREVQLWDIINSQMVKGTTEAAIIAAMLLDGRTATKHFGSTNAKKELDDVLGVRPEGFERVVAENPHLSVPPKKRGLGFKLGPTIPVEERLKRDRIIDGLAKPEEGAPSRDTSDLDIDPQGFADRFEFEGADAQGLFVSLCVAFSTERVGVFLSENDPGGALSLEWVAAMSEELSGEHHVVVEDEAPPEKDKKTGRQKKKPEGEKAKTPEVFDPAKS